MRELRPVDQLVAQLPEARHTKKKSLIECPGVTPQGGTYEETIVSVITHACFVPARLRGAHIARRMV